MTTREADGLDTEAESEKALVLTAYVLHLAGSVAAVPSIVGVVFNYLKRAGAGENFASHHNWMIRTFWWALFWMSIGWVTRPVGWAVLALTWVWFVYRQFFGLIRLANGDSMATSLGHSMA